MEDKSIIDRIEKVKEKWKKKAESISHHNSVFGGNDSACAVMFSCISDLSELLADFYKEQ